MIKDSELINFSAVLQLWSLDLVVVLKLCTDDK